MSWAKRDTTLQKKNNNNNNNNIFIYIQGLTIIAYSYSDPEGTLEKIRTLIQP